MLGRADQAVGRRRAEVDCRLSDGRRLRVAANTVVVAAGALASSLLLQRSGLGGSCVGKDLSFNVGAPMTGDFEERLRLVRRAADLPRLQARRARTS